MSSFLENLAMRSIDTNMAGVPVPPWETVIADSPAETSITSDAAVDSGRMPGNSAPTATIQTAVPAPIIPRAQSPQAVMREVAASVSTSPVPSPAMPAGPALAYWPAALRPSTQPVDVQAPDHRTAAPVGPHVESRGPPMSVPEGRSVQEVPRTPQLPVQAPANVQDERPDLRRIEPHAIEEVREFREVRESQADLRAVGLDVSSEAGVQKLAKTPRQGVVSLPPVVPRPDPSPALTTVTPGDTNTGIVTAREQAAQPPGSPLAQHRQVRVSIGLIEVSVSGNNSPPVPALDRAPATMASVEGFEGFDQIRNYNFGGSR